MRRYDLVLFRHFSLLFFLTNNTQMHYDFILFDFQKMVKKIKKIKNSESFNRKKYEIIIWNISAKVFIG
jgi:hypothetical protein